VADIAVLMGYLKLPVNKMNIDGLMSSTGKDDVHCQQRHLQQDVAYPRYLECFQQVLASQSMPDLRPKQNQHRSGKVPPQAQYMVTYDLVEK
jgi:hypothetical protein